MATLMIVMSHDEVENLVPYALICMTRYGAAWDTMHRRRRWKEEFTEQEREAASEVFRKSRVWTLSKGVPNEVTMSIKTFNLWQKLGEFCASI